MKSKGLWKVVGASVGLIVMVVVAVFVIKAISKVDALDFLQFDCYGADGYGEASAEIDMDALVISELGVDGSEDGFFDALVEYDAYYEGIDVSLDKSDNLKNGDVVTVTVSVSGNVQKKVKGGKKSFTVSGLEAVETVDVFQDMNYRFEGMNGKATLSISNNSIDPFIATCEFVADKKEGLTNGDVITISVVYNPADVGNFGCIPEKETTTITVEGLRTYVSEASQVPKELLEQLTADFLEHKGVPEGNEFWGLSYSNYEYHGSYLLVGRDDSTSYDTNINEIMVVISCERYWDGVYDQTQFFTLVFEDVLLPEEGELSLSFEEGSTDYVYTDFRSKLAEFEEDYTVISLD